MADREPVDLLGFLPPKIYTELMNVIKTDNLDRFKAIFESEAQPLHPEDIYLGFPLLFMAAGCGKDQHYFSPKIIEYLVEEKGADINRMALRTKAEEYSRAYIREIEFNRHANQYEVDQDHVYTTILMNLVLEGNIPACNFFYNHGADLYQTTFDEGDQPVEGETVLILAENKLVQLDTELRNATQENMWFDGHPDYLTKERMKVARGIKWLRYITVDENIPRHVAFWQNRARLREVLRGAPGVGRLETEHVMKFLPKPAKFQKPSNINLRKINATLFEGGRATRKRKQRKQRKTRSHK